jgi:hypothetical protein
VLDETLTEMQTAQEEAASTAAIRGEELDQSEPPHRQSRQISKRALIAGAAIVGLGLIALSVAIVANWPSSNSGTGRPPQTAVGEPVVKTAVIEDVVFTGSEDFPIITISGHNFGLEPKGAPNRCPGPESELNKGRNYGSQLYFVDVNKFLAGGDKSCVGLEILEWSDTRVRFQFGDAYKRPDTPWYITAGDAYEIMLKEQQKRGEIAFDG